MIKWHQISILALIIVATSCSQIRYQLNEGGRDGDGNSFANAEIIYGKPPHFEEKVEPFLLALAKGEPTLANIMLKFARASDTAFYKKDDQDCVLAGEHRSAIIQYPSRVLFCKYYWQPERTDKERVAVWLHELFHVAFYRTETNQDDKEAVIKSLEKAYMSLWEFWEKGDADGFSERLEFLRPRILERELPRLANFVNTEEVIGAYESISIASGHPWTFPRPKEISKYKPHYFDVALNMLWSEDLVNYPSEKDRFQTEGLLQTAKDKAVDFKDTKFMYPANEDPKFISVPGTDQGVPLRPRLLGGVTLTPEFKDLLGRLDQPLIRTIYRRHGSSISHDNSKRFPECETIGCEDFLILFETGE